MRLSFLVWGLSSPRSSQKPRTVKLTVEVLEDRTVPSAGSVTPNLQLLTLQPDATVKSTPPLTPQQIRHAYGFDLVAGDGAGQTIAIVDAYDSPNIVSDLHVFDVRYNLPDPTFTKAMPQGKPAFNFNWSLEIAMDVEWAHAIAPKAKILLVEARTSSYSDILKAVDYAVAQPGVVVVSMSWGSDEWAGERNAAYDGHFAGHPGVVFVASSGDAGAPAGWPAISPNVLAVGGTSLQFTSTGDYASEVGWYGSGGGISPFEAKPAYQQTVTFSSTKRTNPDVAYNADPNTGVAVYSSKNGGWSQVGGTSAGAPQWAALIAIVDQGRAKAGLVPLGTTQVLTAIYSLPAGDFNDVTTGNNGYATKVGYDLVTGRGSPVANKLIPDLIAYTGVVSNASTTSSGGTSGGSVGSSSISRSLIESSALESAIHGKPAFLTGSQDLHPSRYPDITPAATGQRAFTFLLSPESKDIGHPEGNRGGSDQPAPGPTDDSAFAIPAQKPQEFAGDPAESPQSAEPTWPVLDAMDHALADPRWLIELTRVPRNASAAAIEAESQQVSALAGFALAFAGVYLHRPSNKTANPVKMTAAGKCV